MASSKLYTCKLCGDQYTVRASVKAAREIHESRYCSVYWEQAQAPAECPMG